MFTKILIANRGEIACRIARTARDMGILTVAVYSDADRSALHVQACDEAVHIGPSPASKSYLKASRIIKAAQASGAQVIHPGYGFLSENAAFAQRCIDHKINFIGPEPATISAMGSKSAARQAMKKAGVPVLPGFDGSDQNNAQLLAQATKLGFPLLIKAVAGGGGKGLRSVESADVFEAALDTVRRESQRAFGDDTVLLERYLPLARHIEIQIFADTHGNVVHLFERDCSLQRRHQKVIEEAPAVGMSASLRQKMVQTAIDCATAIGYIGAGTVEFLLAPDDTFYFMEMNTRLQVEHAVTEMITGLDLVEWQIRVAAGEVLPRTQSDIKATGHAVEARIYAENPAQDFLPSTGTLSYLNLPPVSDTVRVDTGVREMDEIGADYDPMIAKLICMGSSREQAFARLRRSLSHYQIIGPKNNIHFLARLCGHQKILKGPTDTRFIERNLNELLESDADTAHDAMLVAAMFLSQTSAREIESVQLKSADPWSPWADSAGWRIGAPAACRFRLLAGHTLCDINVEHKDNTFIVKALDQSFNVSLHDFRLPLLNISIDQRLCRAVVKSTEKEISVLIGSAQYHFTRIKKSANDETRRTLKSELSSPMPGKIIVCHARDGHKVEQGEVLMVVEAMKMEHSITAPQTERIETVHYAVGDQVEEGAVLLSFVQ